VRTRTHGHNTGGVDWIGAPANGKEFVMESISIYRLSDGKVVETWGLNDVGALMAQLGGGAPAGTMPA
jgi:predicted ester cyclase